MTSGMIEIIDNKMASLVDSEVEIERIAAGFGFIEGPVWKNGELVFSDIPNDRLIRWKEDKYGPSVTTYRVPSGMSNGNTLDPNDKLITCEHRGRRVSRGESDGSVITVADSYKGKRLNSPNDVVCRSDGTFYFTDPPYGLIHPSNPAPIPSELGFNGVFRVDASGNLDLMCDDFDRPNGLAFSPDEKILYIDDSARGHIRKFQVNDRGDLSDGAVFFDYLSADGMGVPDGMKVDSLGNIWSTGPGSVWVVGPDGSAIGRIYVPENPANLAFGDTDFCTMFFTARTGLYRMSLLIPGLPVGSAVC